MTTNGDKRTKGRLPQLPLLALVLYRNQSKVGSRPTASLRTYERLPPATQANVDALGLRRRFGKIDRVPDELVNQTFRGRDPEAKARAAAGEAGYEVITYQELTFRVRQAAGGGGARKGAARIRGRAGRR